MNGIEINKMNNSMIKKIYLELWSEKFLPGIIKKTPYGSKDSNNSYSFHIDNIERTIKASDESILCKGIKDIFDLNGIEDFEKKFHFACFGRGQEYKEILKLHSSALCPFLIFCSVSKNNPLKLTINEKTYDFTKVHFEYENKVIEGRNPSCVDIVFETEDETIILFLESKFSEYLTKTSNSFKQLSTEYLTGPYCDLYYNDSFLKSVNLQIIKELDGTPVIFENEYNGFQTLTGEKTYLGGIKQMISHHIGLTNFIKPELIDSRVNPKKSEIYLGEILFDFNFEESKSKFDNYEKYYKKLSSALNSLNPNIHVLESVLKYSSFKIDDCDFVLPQKVRDFYFGDMK